MVIIVYVALFVTFFFIAHRKFNQWINVVSVFTLLWCLFGAISSLGLYSMRIPDIKVHQYAWLFVTSVNIPFLLWAKKRNTQSDQKEAELVNSAIAGESCVRVVHIFTLVMLMPLLFKMVENFMSHGSLTAIREYFFSGTVFSSAYTDLLFRQLPFGMLEGLLIYYLYSAVKNNLYRHLVYAIIDTLLATLVSGGRYPIMLFIYSLVIILLVERKRDLFAKRIKILIGIGVVCMFVVTLSRGQAILRSIVVYFSGSFSFMDYIVASPEKFALNDRTYGYLFLGAVFEPIVLMLKVLGVTDMKVPQWHFNIYCQQFYNIGTESAPIYYNNNTSIVYYLLRDFDVVGIAIGGVVFGVVLSKLYNQMIKGRELASLVYIYMTNVLFNTVMTYQFFGVLPLFIFLTFFLCSREACTWIKLRLIRGR